MNSYDIKTDDILIRSKESWFKDILTCLLETMLFLKSSGDVEIEEKSFHDIFTYPKVKNDPVLDNFISEKLASELSFATDKIGYNNDTFNMSVKFFNVNYERWNFVFRIKSNASDEDVANSLNKVLELISDKMLSSRYTPAEEMPEFIIGSSIKYNVEVSSKNFPKKLLFGIF